ncbi:MAG: hypothetical protein IT293_16850 [Deltaproteobacteria bacterium]|nr:hypothetical protein [Deltaproteobacteria bacterium]
MSGPSAITTSGLALIERADRRLAESVRTFTRAAGAAALEAAPTGGAATGEGLAAAAVGVVYGRASGAIGVKLLEVGRDVEKALIDVLA